MNEETKELYTQIYDLRQKILDCVDTSDANAVQLYLNQIVDVAKIIGLQEGEKKYQEIFDKFMTLAK
jgi:ABC-type Fe3+-hydroxamate transport system substrate-binding protein